MLQTYKNICACINPNCRKAGMCLLRYPTAEALIELLPVYHKKPVWKVTWWDYDVELPKEKSKYDYSASKNQFRA